MLHPTQVQVVVSLTQSLGLHWLRMFGALPYARDLGQVFVQSLRILTPQLKSQSNIPNAEPRSSLRNQFGPRLL